MTSGTTACTVKYDQAGDANYNAAPQKTETVTAVKADQATLTVTSPNSGISGDKFTPIATGGTGTGTLSFTASGTACQMGSGADAGKLVITSGTGTCSVTAHKAADANYNSADSAPHAVSIGRVSFLQPIDGELMNIAKLGRVVPVKANIFRDNTSVGQGQGPISIGGAAAIPCNSASGVDDIEVYAAGASNTANQFRWDATGGFWMYNLDTSSLKTGNCYRLDVFYGGTPDGSGRIDVSSASVTRVGYFLLQVTK
jgi:hypothetical protein